MCIHFLDFRLVLLSIYYFSIFFDFLRYEKLCRGEISPDPDLLAQLKCRYVANKPFLKIAPLKLEVANLSPYIVLYHDVMYDNEIELIKQMAKPRVSKCDQLHVRNFSTVILLQICSLVSPGNCSKS